MSTKVVNLRRKSFKPLLCTLFFGLDGFWGQPQGPNFPSPWATMLALCLDCSSAALTTPFIHLKTGWAQDPWLQWSYENWYFHLEIGRRHSWVRIMCLCSPQSPRNNFICVMFFVELFWAVVSLLHWFELSESSVSEDLSSLRND